MCTKLQRKQRDEKARFSPQQKRSFQQGTLQSTSRSSVRSHTKAPKAGGRQAILGDVQLGMLDKAPGAMCEGRTPLLGQRAGRGAASALFLLPWSALQGTLSNASHGPRLLLRVNLHESHHYLESMVVFESPQQ